MSGAPAKLVAYAAEVPPEDPTPDVDFVAHDELDGGGFEELPQPPERPGLRRWRIPLVIAGLLVAAAVVVLAVVVQSSSSGPTASASSSAPTPRPDRSTSPRTRPTRRPDPSTNVLPDRPASPLDFLAGLSSATIAAAHDKCPRLAPTCTTTGEAPIDVLDAVRAVFPHATRLIVLSDVAYQISAGPALAYRRISARSGRTGIAIEIRTPSVSNPTRFGVTYHGRTSYATAETRQRGLTVEVQTSVEQPGSPSVSAVQRLASDPRLLATG